MPGVRYLQEMMIDSSSDALAVAEVIERALQGTGSIEELRRRRKAISNQLSAATPEVILSSCQLLLGNGGVPAWLLFEIINNDRRVLAKMTKEQIEELGAGMASWAAVDIFACYIAGPAWREGVLRDSDVARWAKSEDRWWRRAALVSTVPLNNTARGGVGDTKKTLKICELLRKDREDKVVKALSWALRELSKKDSVAVWEYIRKRQQDLAPRVLREVRNKLATGLKNPAKRRWSA